MTLTTFLKLGRLSNLPTVWSNALAGAVLAAGAGAGTGAGTVALAALALTFFYVGGMWLNDAFDAEIDAAMRADRPIPLGEIPRETVFAGGGLFLVLGIGTAGLLGAEVALAGYALAGTVLLYDWLHKRTALAPVIMGATRFLSYALAAIAAGGFGGDAALGAAGLFAYVIGLTYAAKQEAYDRIERAWPLAVLALPLLVAGWMAAGSGLALALLAALVAVTGLALRRFFRRARGDVPKGVVTLIAGIALYDAVLLAGAGAPVAAGLAAAAFLLTLALQRVVSGT
ncbi:UbiA family prenyltransferase [Paralimibaculum aggregatum]|uniref:UbiA family prenyltransferase n=1 Tax=Paralimibaculum aggregatum TaxID=3036245 RepID=A0ABQ6LLR0_9RHOB|nr:UbiA family prenyltransferase [Limibaculum sp. NKW23]GMG84137.1 UbiA family prenyltransferase [Limibaculum sp. NKW23]